MIGISQLWQTAKTPGPRTLVIGDVHGCAEALRELLRAVELRSEDVLITLGDYTDRGPDSKGVIEQLIEVGQKHTLIPLQGNHDFMFTEIMKNQLFEN